MVWVVKGHDAQRRRDRETRGRDGHTAQMAHAGQQTGVVAYYYKYEECGKNREIPLRVLPAEDTPKIIPELADGQLRCGLYGARYILQIVCSDGGKNRQHQNDRPCCGNGTRYLERAYAEQNA